MSAKIEIQLAAAAMKQAGVSDAKIREVIELLNAEAAAKEDKEKVPAPKKQYVIIVSDPLGKMQGIEVVGWVVQIEEGEAPADAIEIAETAAHLFNGTKRGRLMPVQTIGEAFESCPPWSFKESGMWVKTKMPVQVVVTKNEIEGAPGILPGQKMESAK
jgi:hypothetical protein